MSMAGRGMAMGALGVWLAVRATARCVRLGLARGDMPARECRTAASGREHCCTNKEHGPGV
eukprot:780174-Prymnesium_polylepis.1